jgi:N6-adenosine-specific RNA methylase IME4
VYGLLAGSEDTSAGRAAVVITIEGATRDGELIPISRDLGLRGRVLTVGWDLPDNLTEEEWIAAGELLGKVERSVSWWLGDWWRFKNKSWGEKRAIVDAPDWDGPPYQTASNAAWVCESYPEVSRRRETLSFKHHAEVASLPVDKQEDLLDWCEETIATKGRPRSTSELRGEKHRRATSVGLVPSSDTCTEEDLSALLLSGRKFGCIYADPPWLYDNQGTRAATGNHYKGLTVDELCKLPIRELAAADAHLHLWTTNGFLFEAPKIFEAWGFEFRSTFAWVKPQIGIGNYWRNSHELLLTAIRGDAKRFNDHSMSSWLQCNRGEHSSKPEQVRSMLQKASNGPYLELFGRLPAEGWTVWGNQIERNLFYQDAS